MKKTVTKAYSLPIPVVEHIDKIAKDMNVSASAVVTGMLSLITKWSIEATEQQKTVVLNSLYGKRG